MDDIHTKMVIQVIKSESDWPRIQIGCVATRMLPSIRLNFLFTEGTLLTSDKFFKTFLILFFISSIHYFFFLLYNMVTQLQIHVFILFSHIIMLCHKWLYIVPSARQQDLTANPFQMQ